MVRKMGKLLCLLGFHKWVLEKYTGVNLATEFCVRRGCFWRRVWGKAFRGSALFRKRPEVL